METVEITTKQLDVKICDVVSEAFNTQTYREFIRETEETFGLAPRNLDSMSDEQLNNYLDFMDELWSK